MLIHLLDSQGDGEIDSFEWTTTLRQVRFEWQVFFAAIRLDVTLGIEF